MSQQPYDTRGRGFQVITPGVTQKVSYTGTAAQSSAVADTCNVVQLFATTDCWVLFGANPTAVASAGTSFFLPAGMIVYMGITNAHKISVIRSSASGDLYIIEGA